MTTDSDLLRRLERWYQTNCDGDWEHREGVDIGTLDNPGWRVRISVVDTPLETQPFDRIKIERSDEDWLQVWLEDGSWNAAGGPLNLQEMLAIFLAWAEA